MCVLAHSFLSLRCNTYNYDWWLFDLEPVARSIIPSLIVALVIQFADDNKQFLMQLSVQNESPPQVDIVFESNFGRR